MRAWPMQEARIHLAEFVRESQHRGPQVITWRGREVAVVLSRADDERLTVAGQPLVDFIRESPLFDSDGIDLSRDTSMTREMAL